MFRVSCYNLLLHQLYQAEVEHYYNKIDTFYL